MAPTRHWWSRVQRAAGLVVLAAVSAGPVHTQGTAGSLTGVVTDTLGRPLTGAAIALDPEGDARGTRADGLGRFRFDNVPPGTHHIRTVRIGFAPDDRQVVVGAAGTQVEIRLVPLPFQLDTLTITARRTGVIGRVVARRSLRPLSKSIVNVVGTRWRMVTDTSGRFEFPDVPPGGFVVGIQRDGYLSRMVTVNVPESGAVDVNAALDSLTTNRQRRNENLFRDMRSRTAWRVRNTSAIVGAQELLSGGDSTLDRALRYAPSVLQKGLIPLQSFVCGLAIDGKRDDFARLKDINARDVTLVEVYALSTGCPQPTVKDPRVSVARGQGRPGYIVYVWTRRWMLQDSTTIRPP